MKHNQSGFSIIEVLVSFAVLILVSIGFLNFTENQIKAVKSINASFEVIDFVGQARLILSQPRACLRTLQGLPTTSPTSLPIRDLQGSNIRPNTSPTQWNDYLFKSENSDLTSSRNVKLTSMEIKYPSTFKGEVVLIMKFTRAENASSGGALLERTIPLTVVADPANPTQIKNCFAARAQLSDWSTMCAALGGTPDSVTGTCGGLFGVSYSLDKTPDRDHTERLVYNNGEVRIVVDP